MSIIVSASAFVALMSLLAGVALVSYTVNGAHADAQGPPLRDRLDPGTFPDPPPLRTSVGDNPLYELAAPEEVACDIPELDPDSRESWKGFTRVVGGCLDRLWEPRLADAGLRSDAPAFNVLAEVPGDWPDQATGEGLTLAFYDSADQSINILMPSVTELAEALPKADEGVWAALLSHEYGHHLQNRVGILEQAYENESESESKNEAMDSLRRTELQAECFGGAGVRGFGGFGAAEARTINRLLNGGGDLDSHGSAHNRQHWFLQGWTMETLESCNTYEAPRPLVR